MPFRDDQFGSDIIPSPRLPPVPRRGRKCDGMSRLRLPAARGIVCRGSHNKNKQTVLNKSPGKGTAKSGRLGKTAGKGSGKIPRFKATKIVVNKTGKAAIKGSGKISGKGSGKIARVGARKMARLGSGKTGRSGAGKKSDKFVRPSAHDRCCHVYDGHAHQSEPHVSGVGDCADAHQSDSHCGFGGWHDNGTATTQESVAISSASHVANPSSCAIRESTQCMTGSRRGRPMAIKSRMATIETWLDSVNRETEATKRPCCAPADHRDMSHVTGFHDDSWSGLRPCASNRWPPVESCGALRRGDGSKHEPRFKCGVNNNAYSSSVGHALHVADRRKSPDGDDMRERHKRHALNASRSIICEKVGQGGQQRWGGYWNVPWPGNGMQTNNWSRTTYPSDANWQLPVDASAHAPWCHDVNRCPVTSANHIALPTQAWTGSVEEKQHPLPHAKVPMACRHRDTMNISNNSRCGNVTSTVSRASTAFSSGWRKPHNPCCQMRRPDNRMTRPCGQARGHFNQRCYNRRTPSQSGRSRLSNKKRAKKAASNRFTPTANESIPPLLYHSQPYENRPDANHSAGGPLDSIFGCLKEWVTGGKKTTPLTNANNSNRAGRNCNNSSQCAALFCADGSEQADVCPSTIGRLYSLQDGHVPQAQPTRIVVPRALAKSSPRKTHHSGHSCRDPYCCR